MISEISVKNYNYKYQAPGAHPTGWRPKHWADSNLSLEEGLIYFLHPELAMSTSQEKTPAHSKLNVLSNESLDTVCHLYQAEKWDTKMDNVVKLDPF